MRKKYEIKDLNPKSNSKEEQVRVQKIFEDLKDLSSRNVLLEEREKDFFCICLKLNTFETNGKIEDYEICNDYIFKTTYPIYFASDLKADVFYKPLKAELIVVSEKEKIKDFKYLQKTENIWRKEIEKTNHSNQILQILASETRNDLKDLKTKYGTLKLKFRKHFDDYYYKKDKLILHSKFLFLMIKQITENSKTNDFVFNFLGKEIEIDTYSLIHIINRHYAQLIKENKQKSYHIEDFQPEELHICLIQILSIIQKSEIVKDIELNKLSLNFKGVNYAIWFKKRLKSVKGKIGMIEFYRLETFYPIENVKDLEILKTEFNLEEITEEIKVYIKK